MLTVIARMRAKPGREAEVEAELRKLIEPTRKEKGCINYDLHRSQVEPAVFMFYENWTSRELLDKHLNSPHINAWGKKQPGLLVHGVEVTMYDMLTEAPWLQP
jgi:quinol monooxygenase YgiN